MHIFSHWRKVILPPVKLGLGSGVLPRKERSHLCCKRLKREFPNLADWIEEDIPATIDQQQIFDAFCKFAQLTKPEGKKVLSINKSAPEINFRSIKSYGEYRGEVFKSSRDKVFIGRKFCKAFNRLSGDQRFGTNWDLIMRATIMHEMVHWGDWVKDEVVQPNKPIVDPATLKVLKGKRLKSGLYAGMDVGFQFEAEVFYGIYSTKYLNLN